MRDQHDQPAESDPERDALLSAEALGQMDDEQRQLLEKELLDNVELRAEHEDLSRIAAALANQHALEVSAPPSPELRDAIQTRLDAEAAASSGVGGPWDLGNHPDKPAALSRESGRWSRRRTAVALAVTACLLMLAAIPLAQTWWVRQANHQLDREQQVVLAERQRQANDAMTDAEADLEEFSAALHTYGEGLYTVEETLDLDITELQVGRETQAASEVLLTDGSAAAQIAVIPSPVDRVDRGSVTSGQGRVVAVPFGLESTGGYPGEALRGSQDGYAASPAVTGNGVVVKGDTSSGGMGGGGLSVAATPMSEARMGMSKYFVGGVAYGGVADGAEKRTRFRRYEGEAKSRFGEVEEMPNGLYRLEAGVSREQYEAIVENQFVPVSQQALSTFSIDVDTASYANVRRFLSQNQLPPANAVRIEELINYFSYDYPVPQDDQPFASHLEVTDCPWQPKHRLVRVGLQGKQIERERRPGCNLVFLLDVSGSMKDSNKLPLLKQAMKLLVDQLDENDRVAIVTYASQAGVKLKSTVADNHAVIRAAIDDLNANGSTNGGAGIQMAYEQALAGAIEGGVNRVILATDGDLNVGITDDNALVQLIKEKAASDVFLTVLGFGEGNLKDAKLEKLADNGNGLYAYIDNLREARKVLVEQIEGSLVTIAKDVKIKIEFNPAEVAAYRLIGYENRLMTAAEFDDDKKDAGEIGAGHSVTALYEIVPAAPAQLAAAEPLKYQQPPAPIVPAEQLTDAAKTGELLTLSLRYKLPDSDESTLVEVPLLNVPKQFSEASMDLRFASAVASFGMLLRDSPHRGETSFAAVEEIASAAMGDDEKGYRTEFLDLVRRAGSLK